MKESYLLTLPEAAAYLRIKPKTLRSWNEKKMGPTFYKTGHFIRYRLEDLDAFIEASRVNNSGAVAAVTVSCFPLPSSDVYIASNSDTNYYECAEQMKKELSSNPVYFGETITPKIDEPHTTTLLWEAPKELGDLTITNPESIIMEIEDEESIKEAAAAIALHQAKLKGLIKKE